MKYRQRGFGEALANNGRGEKTNLELEVEEVGVAAPLPSIGNAWLARTLHKALDMDCPELSNEMKMHSISTLAQ